MDIPLPICAQPYFFRLKWGFNHLVAVPFMQVAVPFVQVVVPFMLEAVPFMH